MTYLKTLPKLIHKKRLQSPSRNYWEHWLVKLWDLLRRMDVSLRSLVSTVQLILTQANARYIQVKYILFLNTQNLHSIVFLMEVRYNHIVFFWKMVLSTGKLLNFKISPICPSFQGFNLLDRPYTNLKFYLELPPAITQLKIVFFFLYITF